METETHRYIEDRQSLLCQTSQHELSTTNTVTSAPSPLVTVPHSNTNYSATMGMATVSIQLPLKGSGDKFSLSTDEGGMKVRTNTGQAKQERTRKILITPKVPLFTSFWFGSGRCEPDCWGIPGMAMGVLQAPAGHRTTVISTNSQAEVDNGVLVAPNPSDN